MFFKKRNKQNNVTSEKAYHEMQKALNYDSCPICTLSKNYLIKYFDDFLYEAVNDTDRRKELRSSLGFCNRHAHIMYSLGDPLGHSILYADLINVLIENTYPNMSHEKTASRFQKCPACIFEKEQESYLISVFLRAVEIPDFFRTYRNSFGICYPHFKKVAESCKNNEILEKIKEAETNIMIELRNELNEFTRKCDYRFCNEGFNSEKDSWIRAVRKLMGDF
jgi:hypothetical protein